MEETHAGGARTIEEEDAEFARLVGQRLRAIRQAQGHSLADVEARSGGKWSSSASE